MNSPLSFYNFTRGATAGAPTRLRIDGVIIGGSTWFEGDETGSHSFAQALAQCTGDIDVWINSPGGDVFAGADIYAQLCAYDRGSVHVTCAWAASAASLIAQAASPGKLTILPMGSMFIHRPWSRASGDCDQHDKEAQILREITDGMVGIYMQRFKGTEEELREMLRAETELIGQKAVDSGLVDALCDASPMELSYTAPAAQICAIARNAQVMDATRCAFAAKRCENAASPLPTHTHALPHGTCGHRHNITRDETRIAQIRERAAAIAKKHPAPTTL